MNTLDQNDTMVNMAIAFCVAAHCAVGQVRKYTGEHYYKHCFNVAATVRSVPHTEEMMAAAYLHDVVEDTQVQLFTISGLFNDTVREYVDALSDLLTPEDGNREFRKNAYRDQLAKAPAEVQTIKLADLIDNTKSIVQYDKDFARVYLKEKQALLEVLTKGDSSLYKMAQQQVEEGLKIIYGA